MISGLARMERAKPVILFSFVDYLRFKPIGLIETAFQSLLPHTVKSRLPSASKNWMVALTSEAVGAGEM